MKMAALGILKTKSEAEIQGWLNKVQESCGKGHPCKYLSSIENKISAAGVTGVR
jgi:hypothetical protein